MTQQPKTGRPSKKEHSLFSVTGEKSVRYAVALIIAGTAADAEYYALSELGFVDVSDTILLTDCVYVGLDDIKG
jgi:hypothetical protein